MPHGRIAARSGGADAARANRGPHGRSGARSAGAVTCRLQLDAGHQRIEDARAGFVAGDPSGQAAALVARGDRSPRAWLDAVRELLHKAAYRDGAVLPEHMWRLVEDPTGEASIRAGAAAALASTLDEEGQARLRIAAETCAAPRLRVAFEAAANAAGEHEALEEALACIARDEVDAHPVARS